MSGAPSWPTLQPPPGLSSLLAGYTGVPDDTGMSGDAVFRLATEGRRPIIVKIAEAGRVAGLASEAARLRWLARTGLRAPDVLAEAAYAGRLWLVMTCLPGRNAATSDCAPEVMVDVLASALLSLHALDAAACPFDETLSGKLFRAARNVRCAHVDESQFDDQNAGRCASDILAELERTRPAAEDVTVTHGDACLANLMIDGSRFGGFIDCERLGRADRHQDLALACRSIEGDMGEHWVGPFLRAYGTARIDPHRLRFYRLLDELF